MKLSLYTLLFLILLIIAFFGGARFNQYDAGQNATGASERQILHYVDPMNPAHTSKEPGIAPCGMPMEPVYADDAEGGGSGTPTAAQGTIKINHHKQQIIGVQVGEVTRSAPISTIRALGRITPDANRVYPLIAPTEGWLEEIEESTIGTRVSKNQLLAQIKVYNYDFFTWQQRYLTELGFTNRVNASPAPLSGASQSRRRIASGPGYEAGLPIPESEVRMAKRNANISRLGAENERPQRTEPLALAEGEEAMAEPNPSAFSEEVHADHTGHMPPDAGQQQAGSRADNLRYASKGRLELLNFGVEEQQLKKLEESGFYISHIDLRSPVNGYILARGVSPLQKIDRGSECFKIADLSRVWIEADVFVAEGKYIQAGMRATISAPMQKESFSAVVSKILPRFDPDSRSLKVRLEMDNANYEFRPNMFVDVEFQVPLAESITVPASAVLDSGKRQTVYRVVEEGIFEPRSVVTGWRFNDRVEIVSGLQPGEKIVVSGNFLIDSESRMRLAAAGLMADKADTSLDKPMPAPPQPQAAPQTPPTLLPSPSPAKDATSRHTAKDPVCGMTVDRDTAQTAGLTFDIDGTMYYFCTREDKEQFEQDPQRYLDKMTPHPAPPNTIGQDGHQHD